VTAPAESGGAIEAHFVSDLVETGALDLSVLYASYKEERGYPPYDPRLMVKPLVYGYANGVMSSRRVEAATCRDVAGADAVRRPASRLPPDRAPPPGATLDRELCPSCAPAGLSSRSLWK
jgi:hypothetical protein